MQGFQGVVFNVNPKVNGVTIKNLTIKNVCHDSLSSAIYFDSDDGSVIDCTFINNEGDYHGINPDKSSQDIPEILKFLQK